MVRVPEDFILFGNVVVVAAIILYAVTLWEDRAAHPRLTLLRLQTPVLRAFLLHLAHLVIIFLAARLATEEQEVQTAHRETTEDPVVTLLAYILGRVADGVMAPGVFAATAPPVAFTITGVDAEPPEAVLMAVAEVVVALAAIQE